MRFFIIQHKRFHNICQNRLPVSGFFVDLAFILRLSLINVFFLLLRKSIITLPTEISGSSELRRASVNCPAL